MKKIKNLICIGTFILFLSTTLSLANAEESVPALLELGKGQVFWNGKNNYKMRDKNGVVDKHFFEQHKNKGHDDGKCYLFYKEKQTIFLTDNVAQSIIDNKEKFVKIDHFYETPDKKGTISGFFVEDKLKILIYPESHAKHEICIVNPKINKTSSFHMKRYETPSGFVEKLTKALEALKNKVKKLSSNKIDNLKKLAGKIKQSDDKYLT